MKKSLTVLFSSAGRRVELINCFRTDALAFGLDLRVIAADAQPAMSAACRLADQSRAVPRCTDEAFIPRLLEICAADRVDLLIPTIDTELLPLAEARAQFAALGTAVSVSDVATVAMARNKLQTAAFLESQGVPTPRTLPLHDLLTQPEALRYPVIYKRVDGSSSIGMGEVGSRDELAALRVNPRNYLAQEKWLGREYTVNLYFDPAGGCRMAVPHLRNEVRAGEVSKGVTVRHPRLLELAERLGAALPGARGALCFQAIVTPEGEATVFEINARFGGGYPLTHRAGAPFSRWLLAEAAGCPVTHYGAWQEGVTMLRYDAAVFLPPATP